MHVRSFTLLLAILAAACTADSDGPTIQSSYAKNSAPSGEGMSATFIQGDYTPAAGEQLVLTGEGCLGVVERSFNINFKTDDCLSMTTTAGVTLADDAYFGLGLKSGRFSTIQFWIQDQSGAEGIAHASDKVSLPAGQAPVAGGFTLHVHATLPVWRLKGHLAQKRDQQVGTVTIGDIVYH